VWGKDEHGIDAVVERKRENLRCAMTVLRSSGRIEGLRRCILVRSFRGSWSDVVDRGCRSRLRIKVIMPTFLVSLSKCVEGLRK
jgi:hypothetical protein